MIPIIGLILAIYSIARLVQIPIENMPSEWDYRWVILAVISAPAILVIAFLSLLLLGK